MSFKGEIGEVVESGRGDGEIFSFEWRIPDFPSLPGEGGDDYESPVFDACDGRWWFLIYPKGLWRDLPSKCVNLILFRLDEGPPQTLNIILGIRGPEGVVNKKERRQEFSEYDPACFWYGFCSRSHLTEQKSRLVPGNVLVISLDMKSVVSSVARDASTQTDEDSKKAEVCTEENQSSGKQGVEELVQSLHRLLESKKECDVIIRAQGIEFPAHRSILQARSAVFEAMFSHDMVEKQSGVVNMEDCDPETFPDFLEHVYTGSFEMISSSNVFSLYACSDKYDLGALKQECSKFIKSNMSVASFCKAITLAIKHDDKALIECATEFFCNNSIHIVKTADWQKFLIENAIVGNELFIKLLSKHEDIFVPGS